MVQYTTWTKLVHDEYKNRGGEYGSQGVVQAVTRAAASWWTDNKQQIVELAVDAAKHLVRELMNEYVKHQGHFP